MRYKECLWCFRSVGWVGLVTNSALMLMKSFIGLIAGSSALLADAMYSAKDVVTSILVIVGVNVSGQPLDRDHPYGHGKIEFILSLMISVVFLFITALLFIHALQLLLDSSTHRTPHLIALWAALISIAVNVVMYYYSRCVAIEANSPMVRTLSHHHHADASSSAAVAVGIIGANYLGMPWIDTLVALFETMHLMFLGGEVFRDSYRGLMDRSVSKPMREKIVEIVKSTKGVHEVNHLRTRYIGQELMAEVVLLVDPDITVEEAHGITDVVHHNMSRRIPNLGLVQIKFQSETVRSVVQEAAAIPAEAAAGCEQAAGCSKSKGCSTAVATNPSKDLSLDLESVLD